MIPPEFMRYHYVLDEHMRVVPCRDILEWGRFMEDIEGRRVALNEFGDVQVSTVFLGMDHRFAGKGPPIVFESMVFGMGDDEVMLRYCTWEEAKAGHAKLAREVKALVEDAEASAADVLLYMRSTKGMPR